LKFFKVRLEETEPDGTISSYREQEAPASM